MFYQWQPQNKYQLFLIVQPNVRHEYKAGNSSSLSNQTSPSNIHTTRNNNETALVSNNDIDTIKPTCSLTTILAKNQNQLTLKDGISAMSQLYQVIVEQGNAMVNLLNEMKAV